MNVIPGIWFPGIYEATKEQAYLKQIDRLDTLSNEAFVQQYATQSFPFLLRQAMPTLAPAKAIQQLIDRLGHFKVSVRFGDMSNPDTYINRRTAELTLADFIQHHFLSPISAEIAYAGSSIISEEFLDILGLNYPPYYPILISPAYGWDELEQLRSFIKIFQIILASITLGVNAGHCIPLVTIHIYTW